MKLISLDSSNGDILFEKDNCNCLNINSLVGRRFDEKALRLKIQGLSISSDVINLCNLASLCYKLKIKYDSFECLELLQTIVNIIKEIAKVKFVQNSIQNKLEIDLQPFNKLFEVDSTNSIIYINKIFKDKLNFIGFADCQLINVLTTVKSVEKYIPEDLLNNVGIQNDSTLLTYHYIKEIIS